ncbi:hypothetical protein FBU30_002572 [Linnemannia zychae]|nr:hypothetical protein FBU30_002572 [Linnemannia zychae]
MTSILFVNPDTSTDELASSHDNTNYPEPSSHHHRYHYQHNNQRHGLMNEDTKSSKISGLARLNILQGFSLLGGGGGFLTHEISAIEYEKALALAAGRPSRYSFNNNTNNNKDDHHSSSAIVSNDMTSSTVETATIESTELSSQRGQPSTLWPWSWSKKLQSITTGSRGSMKRYRITVEELSGDLSSDGTTVKSPELEDVDANEDKVIKIATTTAVMPPGVVQWLLNVSYDKPYGFRSPADEEDMADVDGAPVALSIAMSEDVEPQVPLPENTVTNVAQTPPTSATIAEPKFDVNNADSQIEASAPTTADAAATIAAATAATIAANTKSLEKAPATNTPSSTLVDQVTEVRPSWDRINSQPQQPNRRRHSESFTQTTITRPDGTVESKTVTFNRHTGVTETHTRIRRPDGSYIESSTHRLNPTSSANIQGASSPSQQPPTAPHEGGNPYRNHLNRVAAQQQQESDAKAAAAVTVATMAASANSSSATPLSTTSSPPRQSFRERWAQRRQEHREFLEELRSEREREHQEARRRHCERESERGHRERRQELREAEARQREATAAAYGFIPTSSSSSPTSPPPLARFGHDHGNNYRRSRREHEEDEVENEIYEKTRPWPPKGYLKRQEREREEQNQPRHNV